MKIKLLNFKLNQDYKNWFLAKVEKDFLTQHCGGTTSHKLVFLSMFLTEVCAFSSATQNPGGSPTSSPSHFLNQSITVLQILSSRRCLRFVHLFRGPGLGCHHLSPGFLSIFLTSFLMLHLPHVLSTASRGILPNSVSTILQSLYILG